MMPLARTVPDYYVPAHAEWVSIPGYWSANGRILTGDDDFCISVMDGPTWAGVARLTNEEPQEFRDRLIEMLVLTANVYQREVKGFDQHKITFALGDDRYWRIVPLSEVSADMLFCPQQDRTDLPLALAEALLALCRASVATADGGLSIYDDEWDTAAEREED
jgi:hypothetical protein